MDIFTIRQQLRTCLLYTSVGLERTRVGILRTLRVMLVLHHDNVLGQLFYISVDEYV